MNPFGTDDVAVLPAVSGQAETDQAADRGEDDEKILDFMQTRLPLA